MNGNDYRSVKLVEWREEFGKTQEEIALLLNVDRNTIYRAENGKNASFGLLTALCNIYEKPIHDLICPETV